MLVLLLVACCHGPLSCCGACLPVVLALLLDCSLGGFIFEVASSSGERRYNWDDKIVVAMNPLELAKIMRAPDQEHSFYHDTCEYDGGTGYCPNPCVGCER